MKMIVTINGKKFEVTGKKCGSIRMVDDTGRKSGAFHWINELGILETNIPDWFAPYLIPLSRLLK